MPIQTNRRHGGFLAGLLAGGSILVLAGAAPLAAGLSIDWSKVNATGTQIADSGKSGESGESGEGGELGEGGEAGILGSAEPSQIYVTNLLAMKGHLLTARELYDAGDHASAEPHFGHPRAEHLMSVEENAGEAGSDELGERLEHLEEVVVTGGEAGAVDEEWDEAIEVIDEDIDDAIDSADSPLAALVTDAHLVLLQAAHEYEEAIKDGAFAEPVEYQDGRGFYRAVREEVESRTDALRAYNAAKYDELIEALDAIGRAWPSAGAPASPPVSPEELSASIANFEIAALAFR